ncbi:molybdopterin-dependent oxidoreductase, partial [Methylophaga sp. UBA3996]
SLQMWQQSLRAYVLMGLDALHDTAVPAIAKQALKRASFVVALHSFDSEFLRQTADVILPMACFTETSGTFVGLDKQWQQFAGAVAPRGDSRPGWKILRVLGNVSHLDGFDYISSQDVVDEVRQKQAERHTDPAPPYIPDSLNLESDLMMISEVPMYRTDALLRHSEALQKTPETQRIQFARINRKEAAKHNLNHQTPLTLTQQDSVIRLPLEIDDNIADGCVYVAATTEAASRLVSLFGQIAVSQSEAAT